MTNDHLIDSVMECAEEAGVTLDRELANDIAEAVLMDLELGSAPACGPAPEPTPPPSMGMCDARQMWKTLTMRIQDYRDRLGLAWLDSGEIYPEPRP